MIPKTKLTLVETSAWIETLRPKGDIHIREKVIKLLREGQAAWCDMVKLELWNGALAKESPDLEALATKVVVLEITSQVWQRAGSLVRLARDRAKTFPSADLLIFACAQVHGAEIVHKDRHFEQLQSLVS